MVRGNILQQLQIRHAHGVGAEQQGAVAQRSLGKVITFSDSAACLFASPRLFLSFASVGVKIKLSYLLATRARKLSCAARYISHNCVHSLAGQLLRRRRQGVLQRSANHTFKPDFRCLNGSREQQVAVCHCSTINKLCNPLANGYPLHFERLHVLRALTRWLRSISQAQISQRGDSFALGNETAHRPKENQ